MLWVVNLFFDLEIDQIEEVVDDPELSPALTLRWLPTKRVQFAQERWQAFVISITGGLGRRIKGSSGHFHRVAVRRVAPGVERHKVTIWHDQHPPVSVLRSPEIRGGPSPSGHR